MTDLIKQNELESNLKMRFYISAFILVFLVGCGSGNPKTFPVNGQLKFRDGSYPKSGAVEFYHPKTRLNARGKIAADGSFSVGTFEAGDGAVAGHHEVTVVQLGATHLDAKKEVIIIMDDESKNADHDHSDDLDDHSEPVVHRKYIDYRTSDLTVEIGDGTNEILLEIDSQR